jgi:hypothetical protein
MSDANLTQLSFEAGIRRDSQEVAWHDMLGFPTPTSLQGISGRAAISVDPTSVRRASGLSTAIKSIESFELPCGLNGLICRVGGGLWMLVPKHIRPACPFSVLRQYDLDESEPLDLPKDTTGSNQMRKVGDGIIPVIRQGARYMRYFSPERSYLETQDACTPTSAFTVSLWFKPLYTGAPYTGTLIAFRAGAQLPVLIQTVTTAKLKVTVGNSTSTTVASLWASDDETPMMLTVTWSAGNHPAIYVNGVSVQVTTTGTPPQSITSGNLVIGGTANYGCFALGCVVLSNTAASATHIQSWYDLTAPAYLPFENPTYVWLPLVLPCGEIVQRYGESCEIVREIGDDIYLSPDAAEITQPTYVWRQKLFFAYGKLECTAVTGGTVTFNLIGTQYAFPLDIVRPGMILYTRKTTDDHWAGAGFPVTEIGATSLVIQSTGGYWSTGQTYDYNLVWIERPGCPAMDAITATKGSEAGSFDGKPRYVARWIKSRTNTYGAFSPPTDFVDTEGKQVIISGWQATIPAFGVDAIEIWGQIRDGYGILSPFKRVATIELVEWNAQTSRYRYKSIPATYTDTDESNWKEELTDPFVDYYQQPSPFGLATYFNTRLYGARANLMVFSAAGYPEYIPNVDVRLVQASEAENQGGIITIGKDADDEIVGLMPADSSYLATGVTGGSLLVFTRDTTYRWQGWNAQDFTLSTAFAVGLYHQSTLARVGDTILWFDGNDIVAYRGGNIAKVSRPIMPDGAADDVAIWEQVTDKKPYIPAVAWRDYYVIWFPWEEDAYAYRVTTGTWTRFPGSCIDACAFGDTIAVVADDESTIELMFRGAEKQWRCETTDIKTDGTDVLTVERATLLLGSAVTGGSVDAECIVRGTFGIGAHATFAVPSHTGKGNLQAVDVTCPASGNALRYRLTFTGDQTARGLALTIRRRGRNIR